MTAIPDPVNTLSAAINAAHEARIETPRRYLGASVLGDPDDRGLWLSFRGVFEQAFEGRILRLFRRGHLEELTAVDDLRAAGCIMSHTGADQLSVNLGGHLGGHADGIIESGVPEAPKTRHLWECKTHGKKSFDALLKDGVKKAKPMHWVQMQCYMHGLGLSRALYYAVCKDDDRLYTERVEYDKAAAFAAIDRGHRITTADRIPEPRYTDPTYFEAKWSSFYAVYFSASAQQDDWGRLKRQRNSHSPLLARVKCSWRNCARTTVRPDGTWWTEKYDCEIPSDQLDTYSEADHLLHPDVMAMAGWEWLQDQSTPDVFAFRLPTGEVVRNGAPAFGVYSSEELLSAPQVCAAWSDEEGPQSLRANGMRVTADEVPF